MRMFLVIAVGSDGNTYEQARVASTFAEAVAGFCELVEDDVTSVVSIDAKIVDTAPVRVDFAE